MHTAPVNTAFSHALFEPLEARLLLSADATLESGHWISSDVGYRISQDYFLAPERAASELDFPSELGSPPAGERPYGAGETASDTSEYMLGDVYVTVVVFESKGDTANGDEASTEDWSNWDWFEVWPWTSRLSRVREEISAGLGWWETTYSGQGATSSLDFIVDWTYADTPYQTRYEPISHPHTEQLLWIDDWLNGQTLQEQLELGTGWEGMNNFNDRQRVDHNTDWAFTVFVVDSLNDGDGRFEEPTPDDQDDDRHSAYAYGGGPFVMMTYDNDGWGIGDMEIVTAHETGHIFYALDEYPESSSYYEYSGYYNTQNLNAVDDRPSDAPSIEDSIMSDAARERRAYGSHTSPSSTLEQIGWRDTDDDGILDVLDKQLTLQNSSGSFDGTAGQYSFTATSEVQAVENQNPKGSQRDITLNEVDRLEYRLDEGDWATLASYGTFTADINVTVDLPSLEVSTHKIEFRTVADDSGVTSAIFLDTFKYGPDPVREGILDGLGWLRQQQNPNGSWTYHGRIWQENVGVTAMAAQAFLNYGVDESDLDVADAISWILGKQGASGLICAGGYETYDTALAIMALKATGNPAYHDEIEDAAAYLVSTQNDEDTGYNSLNAYFGGWSYGPWQSNWADLSNTQFVLLALHYAEQVNPHDRLIPSSVWDKAETFVQRCQNREASNPQYNFYDDGGFIYLPSGTYWAGGSSYTSMTTAALWGLKTVGADRNDPRVRDAFEWLDDHYEPDENYPIGDTLLYYSAYSTAKACQLWGVRTIGGHPWYEEMSEVLANRQESDGHWEGTHSSDEPDLIGTCWAILALETGLVPQNTSVQFRVDSPVDLHVYDAEGRHVGINYATGEAETQIPGSSYSGPGTEPQLVRIDGPDAGEYRIELVGTGTGPYTLTVDGYYGANLASTAVFSGSIEPGLTYASHLVVSGIAGPITIDVSEPNADPEITGVSFSPTVINEGASATLMGAFTDPEALDEHVVLIEWGDGTSEEVTLPVGARNFSVEHQYLDDIAGQVSVVVSDGVGSDAATLDVSVSNVAPDITELNVDRATVDEGNGIVLTCRFTDPGLLDKHLVSIDWGDGPFQTLALPLGDRGFSAVHWYFDDEPSGTPSDRYAPTVTVTDNDGASDTAAAAEVTVHNLPPAVTVSPVASISEGGTAVLRGTITDPGRPATQTYIHRLDRVDAMIAGTLKSISVTGQVDEADFLDGNDEGRWSAGHLPPGGGGDDYAIVGTGILRVYTAGTFSFAISGDDGGRLRIDGRDVIVDDSLHPVSDRFGEVYLAQGDHAFAWVGFERNGDAGWELSVAVGGGNTNPVSAANGWQVVGDPSPFPEIELNGLIDVTAYYSAVWQSPILYRLVGVDAMTTGEARHTTAASQIDQADIDDNVGDGRWPASNHPVPGGGGDDYAIVGTGILRVHTAGIFSFATSGDDGGRLRIDGRDVIVDDSLHTVSDRFGEVYLAQGDHAFEWVGFERGGGAGWELSVAVGGGNTNPVSAANGWQVVGDPSPFPEIELSGLIDVTSYYLDTSLPETFSVNVDWGDGASDTFALAPGASTFQQTHRYLDEPAGGAASGDYQIRVAVTDDDNGISNTARTTVTVSNVAPTLSDLSVTPTVNEGDVATLSGRISDPGTQDTFTLEIDWADGSPLETLTFLAGTTTFSVIHRYVDDNPSGTPSDDCALRVTLRDDDGGIAPLPFGSVDVLIIYDVRNAETQALESALEAAGMAVSFSATDETGYDGTNPSPVGFDAVIHLNGTTWSTDMPVAGQDALVSFVQSGGAFLHGEWNAYEYLYGRMQHMRDLTLFDRTSGWSGSIVFSDAPGMSAHPVLANVPSTFAVSAGQNVGSVHAFSVSPATVLMVDESGNDAVAVREFGNGRVVGFHHAGNYGGYATLSDSNIQQLYIDGIRWAAQTAGLSLLVRNVAPTVVSGPGQTVGKGESVNLLVPFSDPGATDTHTALIDWGDGKVEAGVVDPVSRTVRGSHVYALGGAYAATVTVTDDDGGQGIGTMAITVKPFLDVTSSMAITPIRSAYDRMKGESIYQLSVKNIGAASYTGRIRLVIANISNPSITLTNATGWTDEGLPYLDLTPYVSGGSFDPGEILGTLTLRFRNPNCLRFTFDCRIQVW